MLEKQPIRRFKYLLSKLLGSAVLSLTLASLSLFPSCSSSDNSGIDAAQNKLTDGSPGTTKVDASHIPDAATQSGPVRFIVMGDTGTGNQTQYAVAAAIKNLCDAQGCDFVLLLGDNFYDAGVDNVEDPLWQEYFERPYQNINLPFYAVLGNHDYGGSFLGVALDGMGNDFEKGPIEVAYTDYSDKWNMPATFYTLRFGNVGFMMMDTNSIMWNDTSNGDQKAWYAAARAELDDADWVFGAGHHPYKSNGAHGDAGEYESIEVGGVEIDNPVAKLAGSNVKEFFDQYVCGSIHMYFSGHDHNRQWVDEPNALCGAPMIVSGAGGKYKAIGTTSNNTLFEDGSKGGFAYVVVDGKNLTLQFVDDQGVMEFEQTITQP